MYAICFDVMVTPTCLTDIVAVQLVVRGGTDSPFLLLSTVGGGICHTGLTAR